MDQRYRDVIDALVRECHEGQGQIAPRRVRAGVWNRGATASEMPDQNARNELLAKVSDADREVLARMLQESFESGVHAVLVALHAAAIEPFDDGYEGSPFHDFMGRLDGWPWPDH